MNGLRFLALLAAIGCLIGVSGYLLAQTTTAPTTSSADNDIESARRAMQRLLDQGPPVTSPTLPGTGVVGKDEAISPRKYKGVNKAGGFLPGAKSPSRNKLLPEGHYIADRRGRLTGINESWMFVFESDGRMLADPPMKILPNRWLEKMESDVSASHESIIFRVSGEVTTYHGQNYLLLRKVLIEREPQDNFK